MRRAHPLHYAALMKFRTTRFTALFLFTVAALGTTAAHADFKSRVSALKCKVALKRDKSGKKKADIVTAIDAQLDVPVLTLESKAKVIKLINYDKKKGVPQRQVRVEFDSYFKDGAGPFVSGMIEHLERNFKDGKFQLSAVGKKTATGEKPKPQWDLTEGDISGFRWTSGTVTTSVLPKALVECDRIRMEPTETEGSARAAEADLE